MYAITFSDSKHRMSTCDYPLWLTGAAISISDCCVVVQSEQIGNGEARLLLACA